MRKIITIAMLLVGCLSMMAKPIGEYFKVIPDSLCPMMRGTTLLEETVDYLYARVSDSSTIEMRFLNDVNNNKVICLVKTFDYKCTDSEVYIYDLNWNLISDVAFDYEIFDSLQVADRPYYDPMLIGARLSENTETISLTLSPFYPISESDTEKKYEKMLTTLYWDGEKFKKRL